MVISGLSNGDEPGLVNTPTRATIQAWMNEIARLSPESHQKLLDKWSVESLDDVADEALYAFAVSVRSTLDALRTVLKDAVARNVSMAKSNRGRNNGKRR